jgi:carbon-monoxide dehydrogenase medium subunit
VSAGALVQRAPQGTCAASRISIGGLGGAPIRAVATEKELQGKPLSPANIAAAAARAVEGSDPDGDTYASAEYKLHVATLYARKAIETAAARAAAGVAT